MENRIDRDGNIEHAVKALQDGRAVCFPTDTVYGIGVSVLHADSIDELFSIKGRPLNKPVAWLVGSPCDLERFGNNISCNAKKLAESFWPGPLTLIVDASSDVDPLFLKGYSTIALRMPKSQTALSLIRSIGCPIATTSANASGEPAVAKSHELSHGVIDNISVVVFNDNECSLDARASTIVDCTKDSCEVVREGAISSEMIKEVLNR